MIGPKPSTTAIGDLLDRRWVGIGYATFALALLVLTALPVANVVIQMPVVVFMVSLLIAAPVTGMVLGRGRRAATRAPAAAKQDSGHWCGDQQRAQEQRHWHMDDDIRHRQ